MKYDIICIGAGSGGLNIASFMNKAGFKVLLIDKKDETIGGDCLNFGCVPSKALIHVSRMAHEAKESSEFGLKAEGKIDLKKVMDYVKSKQDVIREHENAHYFRKRGMDVELGEAKFVSEDSISINGKTHTAKNIILATGSRPRELKIPGVEKVNYQTNETIFQLEKLPEKFVVIGGGPIGIELGQAFSRLGSKVTILERGNQFLPKESKEIANVLLKQLEKEGITVMFNTSTKEFKDEHTLVIEQDGEEKEIEFDEALVSIGRVLNIENLDLEKAGIEVDNGRIKVDAQLRTTNRKVLLCGDVAGSYQFTHAAELHAGVIISNFFSPLKKKLNNDKLSWVTYTSPEIATFGLSEKQLQEREEEYEKLSIDFHDDDRAIVDDFTGGVLKLFLVDNRIAGGSMVAMNAGELAQELILAMSSDLDIKHIFNKIYPYPTASRINKKIISTYFSKKLTPFSKKVLKTLY